MITEAACPTLGLAPGSSVIIANANIAAMLSLYPNPNNGANSYLFGPSTKVEVNHAQVRFDQSFSSSDSFFARYTIDSANINSANNQGIPIPSGTAFPQFRGGGYDLDQFITLSETHTISPSMSNTARLAFSRTHFGSFPINVGSRTAYSQSLSTAGGRETSSLSRPGSRLRRFWLPTALTPATLLPCRIALTSTLKPIPQGTVLTNAEGGTYVAAANFIPYNSHTVITGNPSQWFNPNMFHMQPMVPCPNNAALICGTLGDAARGILRGPDMGEWDFSIVKDTAVPLLGKQGSVQFRTEIFNILNHTNLGMPASATVFNGATSILGAYQQAPLAGVGQITTTATTSRQIQFALKLIF